MTKTVRVENADSGTGFDVEVQVVDKGQVFEDGTNAPDTVAETHLLPYPTRMMEFTLTSNRYLIVRDVPHKA
jgi:hypothetical protein